MKGRNDTWTDMAAAAAFAVVLGISAFWGQPDRAYDQARGRTGSAYGRMYEQAGPEDENGNPVSKADAYPDTAGAVQAAEGPGENPARPGGEDAEILPDVTESQKAVLDEIMEALEAQDLESAARSWTAVRRSFLRCFMRSWTERGISMTASHSACP